MTTSDRSNDPPMKGSSPPSFQVEGIGEFQSGRAAEPARSDSEETSLGGSGRGLLLAQVREAYGRVAYTHKTHEKQADLCFERHRKQQRLLIALTVISSGTFLVSLLGLVLDQSWAALVTSFIAVVVTATNLGSKTFNYGEETQKHRDAAAKVWNLRESYQSLIVDLQAELVTIDEGRARRDGLQREALEIYSDAPRTTGKAYTRAQAALQEKEDLTFTSREIDLLLPVELRSAQERDLGGDQ